MKCGSGGESREGRFMKKLGFSNVFRFGGEESRGDGGLAGERRNPPQSRLPQSCLLALSLDALSFLQTSLLVHPRLPSSVLLIPFSTPSPPALESPSSSFSPFFPHPSHLSALVALVLVPRLFLFVTIILFLLLLFLLVLLFILSSPHLLVSLVLLPIPHPTPFVPWFFRSSPTYFLSCSPSSAPFSSPDLLPSLATFHSQAPPPSTSESPSETKAQEPQTASVS